MTDFECMLTMNDELKVSIQKEEELKSILVEETGILHNENNRQEQRIINNKRNPSLNTSIFFILTVH